MQSRVGNLLIGFSSESLVFSEQKYDSLVFLGESHFCSFVMSNLSKWSLFCKERCERFALGEKTYEKYEFFKQITHIALF